mmetsp:Transcript_64674/g.171216  ORF Transcript_64674/g.171216 Transcript_64674/m.171216 type:complete len:93 (-) Transcript_64674:174-452(-)
MTRTTTMVLEAPREHTNRSLSTRTLKVRREDRSLQDVDGDHHMGIESCVVRCFRIRGKANVHDMEFCSRRRSVWPTRCRHQPCPSPCESQAG